MLFILLRPRGAPTRIYHIKKVWCAFARQTFNSLLRRTDNYSATTAALS